jgi:hypothetical protein
MNGNLRLLIKSCGPKKFHSNEIPMNGNLILLIKIHILALGKGLRSKRIMFRGWLLKNVTLYAST